MATDGRGKGKPWTEAEKLAILFQIIEKSGTIDYDALQLPEGRTKKAVQVMVDREKGKVRRAATVANGGEDEGGSQVPNDEAGSNARKRKANDDAAGSKKAKKPAGKKQQVKAGEDVQGDEGESEAVATSGVKPEPEDE